MTQQTAVEWLFQQLWDEPKDKFTWYALREKAKQMEKQEKRLDIISAFESGKLMGKANSNKTGDEYYFCNYIDNE